MQLPSPNQANQLKTETIAKLNKSQISNQRIDTRFSEQPKNQLI